jgi:hypothetical protein
MASSRCASRADDTGRAIVFVGWKWFKLEEKRHSPVLLEGAKHIVPKRYSHKKGSGRQKGVEDRRELNRLRAGLS